MTQFEGELVIQQVRPNIILTKPEAPQIVMVTPAQGPAGADGAQGPVGPTGPAGDGAADPGDLTLIFFNKLI